MQSAWLLEIAAEVDQVHRKIVLSIIGTRDSTGEGESVLKMINRVNERKAGIIVR